MSSRNKLRSALLSVKPEFRKEIVEVNGESYEVRQPSVKSRKELFSRCTDEKGRVQMGDFTVWAVILNTYDPKTNELVFEESDYDVLMGLPSGGAVDKLGEVAVKLLNVEADIDNKSKGA